MLKRIDTSQLRLGMYIHELCGSWMEHPFWRSKFLLTDPADLKRVHDSGIQKVWIDTSKGADLPPDLLADSDTPDEQIAREEAEQTLLHAIQAPSTIIQTSLDEELRHATRLCQEAKGKVTAMFTEARMGRAIATDHLAPLVDEISGSVLRNPSAFISLARLKKRDEYTYMHSVAVCALMIALAKQQGMEGDALHQAGLAGLLHDIGKAVIDEKILNKPGKLSDDEFTLIKTHPEEGSRLLLEGRGTGAIPLDVCLHHHEKMNGTGYPHRLDSNHISLFARMGAVCDVYDAVTSDRPYKSGWDPAEALRKMAEWSHGHFDEQVFQSFVKSVGIYPTGSLVRLESGRLGVVLDQSPDSLLTPRIKVFFSTRARNHIRPEIVDLSHPGCTERIASYELAEKWNLGDLKHLWLES